MIRLFAKRKRVHIVSFLILLFVGYQLISYGSTDSSQYAEVPAPTFKSSVDDRLTQKEDDLLSEEDYRIPLKAAPIVASESNDNNNKDETLIAPGPKTDVFADVDKPISADQKQLEAEQLLDSANIPETDSNEQAADAEQSKEAAALSNAAAAAEDSDPKAIGPPTVDDSSAAPAAIQAPIDTIMDVDPVDRKWFNLSSYWIMGYYTDTSARKTKPSDDIKPVPIAQLPRPVKFPKDNYRPAPTGSVKFPKIQAHSFEESELEKLTRLRRQNYVKKVFEDSWAQYKKHAWGHDEVMPVTQKAIDPFLGWAATLIDALDTLYIMDLMSEYKECLELIATIDFTNTWRHDLPLFETVIRTLGGLISAYDLNGGKDAILLTKACELADNLLGAFDTPNGMPIAFYKWEDKESRVNYLASKIACVAEIGSLSLEFARLAQITGNASYYEAIAGVTDALYEYAPTTTYPGLFPVYLDMTGVTISGGAANDHLLYRNATDDNNELFPGTPNRNLKQEADSGAANYHGNPFSGRNRNGFAATQENYSPTSFQEYLEYYKGSPAYLHDENGKLLEQTGRDKFFPRVWKSQNPMVATGAMSNKFTMNGMVDSVYEYMMKTYQLLAGGESKYKDMYENASAQAKKHFVFKPFVPDNEDIYFLGSFTGKKDGEPVYDNEQAHLGCFSGGMFALAGKLLNKPEDVEYGRKLTKGCVWSYNSTRTGVMPESFSVRRCPNDDDNCDYSLAENAPKLKNGRNPNLKAYDMPLSFLRVDPTYIMRPEALESVFYMWRITGDKTWQDDGFRMFQSIVSLTQVLDNTKKSIQGYSSVKDVTNNETVTFTDSAESFWMGETLKYAYLLFSEPNLVSLDEWVFNTEAHPFKVAKPVDFIQETNSESKPKSTKADVAADVKLASESSGGL